MAREEDLSRGKEREREREQGEANTEEEGKMGNVESRGAGWFFRQAWRHPALCS